jgi:BTB/POZ domain
MEKANSVVHRLMGGDKVQVYAGPTKTCYVVPKKLLCEKSSYFRSAFTGGFEETESGKSELPEIEAETFEAILKWLMSGIIEVPKKVLTAHRSFIDERLELLPLVQTYLGAQFLDLEELRKEAMQAIQKSTIESQTNVSTRERQNNLSTLDRQTNLLTLERQTNLPMRLPTASHAFLPRPQDELPDELAGCEFLDGKPGFSPDLVKLVLERDQNGGLRDIVKKCLGQAFATGGEYVGIYGEVFKSHPSFALEVMEEMQRSRSAHLCPGRPISYYEGSIAYGGGANYPFDKLKERRERECLYTEEDWDRHLRGEDPSVGATEATRRAGG